MRAKQRKWTFNSLAHFKDHLRAHCKPAYQRQNKDHYKDNLLTVMQVFSNAMDFAKKNETLFFNN